MSAYLLLELGEEGIAEEEGLALQVAPQQPATFPQ
jgi:hypothetical protein